MTRLHFCISESRREDEVGVKLLVLSLRRHEPDAILHLFVDSLGEDLRAWLASVPNVVLETADAPAGGWNVKPWLLESLLEGGLDEVIWIDSDVVLTAPVRRFFAGQPPDVVVIAEERYIRRTNGVAVRTRGWGLPVGRELPFTPNSCILRLTRHHLPLLRAWRDLLSRPDYKAAQAGPWYERPFYMMGDQDALTALLGSEAFGDLPVRCVRQGVDIAQCYAGDGYGPLHRVINLRRLPPFVHAQGSKPWRPGERDSHFHLQLSPYTYAAAPLASGLTEEEREWLGQRSPLAWALHFASMGNPNIAGLWPALFTRMTKGLDLVSRPIRSRLRRPSS